MLIPVGNSVEHWVRGWLVRALLLWASLLGDRSQLVIHLCYLWTLLIWVKRYRRMGGVDDAVVKPESYPLTLGTERKENEPVRARVQVHPENGNSKRRLKSSVGSASVPDVAQFQPVFTRPLPPVTRDTHVHERARPAFLSGQKFESEWEIRRRRANPQASSLLRALGINYRIGMRHTRMRDL